MNKVFHGEYQKLPKFKADLILTSPPFNIGSRSPRQDGQRRFGKYDPKSYGGITGYSDSVPEDKYQDLQVLFLRWCTKHLTANGVLVYNHKPRRSNGVMIHPLQWILRVPELNLMEEVIWDRGSTHNHSSGLMWPHTERLYVMRLAGGKYPLINHAELPQRSDVWRIGRAKPNGHAAPYPVEIAEAAIAAWSKPGDLVCDPYLGSGTTAVAAVKMGRQFIGSEKSKKYYSLALGRIQDATGRQCSRAEDTRLHQEAAALDQDGAIRSCCS